MCIRFYFGGIIRISYALICFVTLLAGAALNTARAEITRYGNVFRVDPSFSTLIEANGDAMTINAVATTSDGGFLVGGNFTALGGQQHLGLAKFKADGTVDSTFNLNGGFDGAVESIAVQADGRILVAGDFASFNGTTHAGFVRLNADGTLDETFNPGSGFTNVGALMVQSDGRILVGPRVRYFAVASFLTNNSTANGAVALADVAVGDLSKGIARLNTDGTVDSTFNPSGTGFDGSVQCIAVQADGRIVVGGSFTSFNGSPRAFIARLNSDGTLDTTFDPGSGFDSSVGSFAMQADGKLLAVGYFSTFNGTACPCLVRLNANGTLDTSFTLASGLGFTPTKMALQTDGKIVVGGVFTNYVAGSTPADTARLKVDGSLDSTYVPASSNYLNVQALALQTNGRIVVGGDFYISDGSSMASLMRLTTTGAPDTLSTGNSRCLGSVREAVPLTGGKYVVAGGFNWVSGTATNGIARINADGSVDTSFNIGSGFNYAVECLAVQSDGKIVAGGGFTMFNGTARAGIARLNANGTLDTTFIPDVGIIYGSIDSLALQADGRIVAGGYFSFTNSGYNPGVIRLNADGALDPVFGSNFGLSPGVNGQVGSLAVQTDGRIVAGGHITAAGAGSADGIARLNTDGTFDPSFIPGSGANATSLCVTLQSDAAILVGGNFTTFGGFARNGIARLKANGTLDTSFDPGIGFFGTTSITLQGDGRMVVGSRYLFGGPERLNADGSRDGGFSLIGYNGYATSIHYTEDGHLLLTGGIALGAGGLKQVGVVILKSDTTIVSSSSSSSGGSNSSSSSSSGSSGGGAPGEWFVLAALALLVGGRRRLLRK